MQYNERPPVTTASANASLALQSFHEATARKSLQQEAIGGSTSTPATHTRALNQPVLVPAQCVDLTSLWRTPRTHNSSGVDASKQAVAQVNKYPLQLVANEISVAASGSLPFSRALGNGFIPSTAMVVRSAPSPPSPWLPSPWLGHVTLELKPYAVLRVEASVEDTHPILPPSITSDLHSWKMNGQVTGGLLLMLSFLLNVLARRCFRQCVLRTRAGESQQSPMDGGLASACVEMETETVNNSTQGIITESEVMTDASLEVEEEVVALQSTLQVGASLEEEEAVDEALGQQAGGDDGAAVEGDLRWPVCKAMNE
jgi:hypothetical protein